MPKPNRKSRSLIDSDFSTREMLLLLISLVFMLLIVPLVDAHVRTDIYRPLGLSLVVAALAWRVRWKRNELVATAVLAALVIPLIWSSFLINSRSLFVISSAIEAAVFTLAALRILDRVFRLHLQTFQAVWGAICAYLLLGLSWAMIYWVLISLDDAAFQFTFEPLVIDTQWQPPVLFSRVVYFSFVTMTTLGYGDFSPVSPVAQAASWMQAVVGQFYIAVFVARLVAMLPRPQAGSQDVPLR